jgi:hypothetical protein
MNKDNHTCGLNFYCKGCYDIGYGEGVRDATSPASEPIEKLCMKEIIKNRPAFQYDEMADKINEIIDRLNLIPTKG